MSTRKTPVQRAAAIGHNMLAMEAEILPSGAILYEPRCSCGWRGAKSRSRVATVRMNEHAREAIATSGETRA